MKKTPVKIGIASALLLAGVALLLWQESRLNNMTAENAQLKNQTAQLASMQAEVERLHQADTAELKRLRASVAQMQNDLARLRGGASEARRAKEEAVELRTELARQSAESATNQSTGAMGELMQSAIEQQMQGRLARMKTKLNLTPDQAKAIEDILLAQARQGASMMQKIMSGKLTKEETGKLRDAAANPERNITALLTPEQQTAYKELQSEEAVANARLAANSELLQMQSTLGLSPEQQERVAAVLYEHTLAQMTDTSSPKPTNPAEAIQTLLDKKLKALEPLLSAEQLDKYRQLQETQLKFLKNVMNQMEPASPPK